MYKAKYTWIEPWCVCPPVFPKYPYIRVVTERLLIVRYEIGTKDA